LEKIKQGDFSGFSEINDVNAHIEDLKNETIVLVDIGSHNEVY